MSGNTCPLPLLEYGEHQKPKGWKAAAPTRCQRLRELLADGAWHSHAAMTQAGGARFGARLLEMRRGQDGGTPWDVDVRSSPEDDRRTEYRLVGEAAPYVAPPVCVRPKCAACGQEVPAEVAP